MKQYGRWLAGEPGAEPSGLHEGYRARHPVGEVRASKASFFAHRTVQRELVRRLEQRPDFQDYFRRLREDTAYQAKEFARDQLVENFEARQAGLRKAAGWTEVDGKVTYNVVDAKAVEHYTRPYLEHGFPKKSQDAPPPQKFVINLFGASPEQKAMVLKAMAGEVEEPIEYELLPNPKLLEAGDD